RFMEVINMVKRSLAGTLREKHIDETVLLKGWVDKRRDLGGLIFVDLRDKSGAIQVVFNPDYSQAALEIAETIRSEFVIEIKGQVIKRDETTVNAAMKTGTIEVLATDISVLNKAKNPPFLIQDDNGVSEDLRLKYRYLDLRDRKSTRLNSSHVSIS